MLDSNIQRKALELFVAQFRSSAKKKLASSKRGIWSGKLLESINGSVEFDDGEWNFFLDMEEYGEFIDEGVNGTEKSWGSRFSYTTKKPPINKIKSWASSKGLNPWAVQQSIFKKGIKPVKFFENVLDKELSKMVDYLAEASATSLLNDFGEE